MKEFIEKNNLMFSSQYGFRKSHSTEHAILDYFGGQLFFVNCLYSETRVMLKLARRARGHFVTLIEILVHIIRVKPGHIPSFCKFNTFTVFRKKRSRF